VTVSQRGAPRFASPSDRSITVTARFAVYRHIGRRPSQVYVDEAMKPVASGVAERRLSDHVFWRTHAEIGDQIEERGGGFLLLTEPMLAHPIQLSEPRPLNVTTAFSHADIVLREDREILEKLLAEGSAVEGSPRRPRTMPTRIPDTLFAEDHPLVVTTRPKDLDMPAANGSDSGGHRHPIRRSRTGWQH